MESHLIELKQEAINKPSLIPTVILLECINAVMNDNTELLQQYLDIDPARCNMRYYSTPILTYACRYNGINSVKLLLKYGAFVNATDSDGWTALIEACKYKSSLEIIKLLVENGADIMHETKPEFMCGWQYNAIYFVKDKEIKDYLMESAGLQ